MRNDTFQIAPNAQLRVRLDDIYVCLADCLDRLRVQEAFDEVSDALCKEMDALLLYLGELEEQYEEELPLESEEPKDVEWLKESETMTTYRQQFQTHTFAQNKASVVSLMKRLGIACEVMERIDQKLYPEDDPDIYASYSKRELKDYLLNRWNKASRELRNQLASAPSTHQKEYFEAKIAIVLEQLHDIPGYFINEDSTVIYYEGLGRHLWQLRHTTDFAHTMDDVLRMIKTAEYYSGRMQRKFIYLDRETSSEEEQNEQVRMERLVQETLQSQLSRAVFRLGFCKAHFAKEFSEGFLGKMFYDLIKSEHSAQVCDKMSMRKINKFTHQVAGVLRAQEVFVDCSYGDLADAMKFTSPRKQSRMDYIRHMVDDVPEIQTWLETYIQTYKQELKQKEAAEQQGSVNVNC